MSTEESDQKSFITLYIKHTWNNKVENKNEHHRISEKYKRGFNLDFSDYKIVIELKDIIKFNNQIDEFSLINLGFNIYSSGIKNDEIFMELYVNRSYTKTNVNIKNIKIYKHKHYCKYNILNNKNFGTYIYLKKRYILSKFLFNNNEFIDPKLVNRIDINKKQMNKIFKKYVKI